MTRTGTTTAPARLTARDEWRANWLLVLSAMAAVTFGAIPSTTLGLFMAPLSEEFGWSRTQISAGMMVFAIVTTPLAPFAGALVDRFGPRRVAIPGMALTGLAFAAFALLTASYIQWIAHWVVFSLASMLIRGMVMSTAVGSAFTVGRGLALAVLLSGLGLASSLAPIAAERLIALFGWRGAYLGFGLGWGGFVLVLLVLFFRIRQTGPATAGTVRTLPGGLTLPQALRNPQTLRITFAIFLQSVLGAAFLVHLVPLLTHSGIERSQAAGVAAFYGIGSILGKLVTGWLADRVRSSLLPFSSFALPAVGYGLLLGAEGSPAASSLGIAVIGYGSGAAIHMTTYLTTQYAGLRNFGKIFGAVSSLMGLAAGLGPLAAGAIFDTTQSYAALLIAAIPAALIAGIAVTGLGPYPLFAAPDPDKASG